jgi:Leucine-rich repeat (LRR) protein
LRVLSLSGCEKLENTLDFKHLSNLEYLDMDRCASLSTIHESIGALAELRFLSLRYCINLVEIPGLNNMTSLTTLDLYGCSKLTSLPLIVFNHSSRLESLIFLDVSFCNISEVPDAIGELRCLERLNLQGNNMTTLPSSIERLYHLPYLNLSHCHKLQSLPELPSENGPSDSVGRYFKTTSGSRNQRSGLYIFDTPHCIRYDLDGCVTSWTLRLLKVCNTIISPSFISLFISYVFYLILLCHQTLKSNIFKLVSFTYA